MPDCHLCPATFLGDNDLAEHVGRHRNAHNDNGTNQRQARRGVTERLLTLLDTLEDPDA